MKKKSTEIATNKSSGAEKVENIQQAADEEKQKTVKKAAEEKAAQKRVDAALKKKEQKEKRRADKLAVIEKRKADKKAKAEKHAAERKALAEKRAAEKEKRLHSRAKAKANRNNAYAKRKSQRAKQREGNKGYGGWIAAVVSLGVVSLALATTVTVGAMEMKKGKDALMSSYKSTMYELTGIMENVDGDLDRVRVSDSAFQQSRILTDLLVQTRLAELDIEKLPISAEAERSLALFVNRTAGVCEHLLAKLRSGEGLNEMDRALLEKLYQTNNRLNEELRALIENTTDKDLMRFIKNGDGKMKETLDKLDQTTLEENMNNFGDKLKEGKDKIEEKLADGKDKIKEGIRKKTDIGSKVKPVGGEKARIETSQAEELCAKYFSDYGITKFQCIGETTARGFSAYNVQGYDAKGNHLFAEVRQEDGKLLRFDYYEDCTGETFDIRNAERIAEEFLEKLGYDDMEVVRLRSNGSTSDFTFVYEDDGVVYYPDEVRVKVCRTRGVVSGFDGTKYLQNHKKREELPVRLTLAEAYSKLYDGLSVESARLSVVQTARGERPSYEFLCGYQDENYFVFLDAESGEEISIVNTKNIR